MSKVFVLRTHALLSSRRSTLRFGEDNEIVIPLFVVDELRKMRQESFEKGRIARELMEYLNSFPIDELISKKGVIQSNGSILRIVESPVVESEMQMDGLSEYERKTLQVCRNIQKSEKKNVVLVTNNPFLQLNAKMLGIKAERLKDEVFPKLDEQYTGRGKVYTDDISLNLFYKQGYIEIDSIFNKEKVEFVNNKFFVIASESKSALGIFRNGKIVKLKYQNRYPYNIKPKNVGQKFMIEALLDETFPLVVIKGNAGTGKTFCTLAAGLQETEENKKYSRILVTRSVTATEQYGFLPGDIEDKLSPYLAGIKDNLSILIHGSETKNRYYKDNISVYEDGSIYFEKGTIQIQAIGFLRGRSIVDTYFIIDETQNIEPDVIKSIVTRAAKGSKFIFLGDPTQIDNPNLTERYNGLVYLSEKMKGNQMCAQITLEDNESVRSDLAREAAKIL